MKKYKQTNTHYGNFTDIETNFLINNTFHGFFIVSSPYNNIYYFKGYFNTGNQYSHWVETEKYIFKYHL